MTPDYELTLHDYIDILRRHVILVSIIVVSISIASIAMAILLPPVYQSSGTILIESQQISAEFIPTSTSYAGERIEIVKQRVMTRENLLHIVKKYRLFESSADSRISSTLIENMRRRIMVNILSAGGGRRGNNATIAFSVGFEDRHAERAYGVSNELVTLFLDENVKSRVERATETTDFLGQEAKRLKNDLEKMESLVAAYKQEHSGALPEHLSLKINSLQQTQATLAEVNRDYKATENELRRLDIDLTAAESGTGADGLSGTALERLHAEYQQAIILYKPNHPTVRLLKRKIEALEKGTESGVDSTRQESNLLNTTLIFKIRSSIKDAKIRLTSLEEQRKPLRNKITELEQQIVKTPQVELGLSSLLRDHVSAKSKYEEIQAKELSAQIAENLEGENKSERFTLIDPPLLADRPIKPNRFKIIILGIFFAFAAAGGVVFLLETLNQKIRGKGALTVLLEQSPLVEIPYIMTDDERLQRKVIIKRALVITVVLFITSLIIVHFAYMELDILFYKIWTRLG